MPTNPSKVIEMEAKRRFGAVAVARTLRVIGVKGAAMAKQAARSKFPSSKFWGDIAKSCFQKVDTDAGSVTIGSSHFAAMHKEHGGKIAAPGQTAASMNAKMLAWRIDGKKSGGKKSLRDFSGPSYKIYFRKSAKGGLIAFVEKVKPPRKGKRKGASTYQQPETEAVFALKKSVRQKPEHWWPRAAMDAMAEAELKKMVGG